MRWREYPVLAEDDDLLAEFRLGLGDDAARVLAYLVGRRESPEIDTDEATRLAVRVGTGLGREPTIAALSTLEDQGLVTTTTIPRDTGGRPPKGWVAAADAETLARRLRGRHSRRLLERAREVADYLGTSLPTDWPGTVELGVAEAGGVDEPTTDLSVALNWVPNGLHAPLIAATDLDIYRDHGIDVGLEAARGSGAALERLRSGAADVAVVGAASLCRAERGAFVPVALLYQRSMAVLYTTTGRLGEPFDSVEQLRGRRLAVTPDSEVGRLARLFLAQAGVLEEVEIVPTSGEEREALERGEADVATGMPIDPRELAAAGHDVSSLSVADHFPVPGPALVTTAATAAETPEAAARFLMGTLAGTAAVRRDPGRAAVSVADRSGEDVASERWRIEHALGGSLDGRLVRKRGWGWQTTADWERLEAALRQEAHG
jgi:ABC-type nitrate/sulfonate/bicarbonate transport system substrate-binding protein